MKHLAIVAVLIAAACGGGSKPAATSTTTPAAAPTSEHAEEHAEEHGHSGLTPELEAFHDVLAPRWHSPAGPERMKATCSAIADFMARAQAIQGAATPAQVEASQWTDSAASLSASVSGLESACQGTDQAAFDSAFSAVHERFHHAMELVVKNRESAARSVTIHR